MKRSYKNIRKSPRKVSENLLVTSRFVDVMYNGGVEEYEDLADYYEIRTVKGVRVA